MEPKSSKQSEGWGTSLWNKYTTDIFFRTTCHIIFLQAILTLVIVTGLWYVMEYLVTEASQTLIHTFTEMLRGQPVTADSISKNLEAVRIDQYWPVVVVATAVIISFGFIMVYIALTPTRRSLERKKRFVSNISHELRTPLAIMRTNTDVALLDVETPEKVKDMLKRNIVEFDRMNEIMNNLLNLSNVLHDQQLQFESVDLNQVAKRAIDLLTESLDHKDITISLKSHTSHKVRGNASALEQVVFNLLKNAIAHIRSRGTVTVEIDLSRDDRYIDLSVADTGSGIARNDLFHVFEPFYRSRGSTKNTQGQGLGLAIVNEIIQLHKGKIKIKSAVGRGTTVIVSIRRDLTGATAAQAEDSDDMEEVTLDFSHRILR